MPSSLAHSITTPKFNPSAAPARRRAALRVVESAGTPRGDTLHDAHAVSSSAGAVLPSVSIAPTSAVKRRSANWNGMAAEIVQTSSGQTLTFKFKAPVHMLVLYERGARRDGETRIAGLPSSALLDVARKFVLVPAGHDYSERHEPRSPGRIGFFYVDVNMLPQAGTDPLSPRLFFEHDPLFATAQKLIAEIERPDGSDHDYLEALGRVLAHELATLNRAAPAQRTIARGGLAAWQKRIVAAHIEEHLAEPIRLATLAELAGLSSYHFCRAFKQSFGMPPHRYHTRRRIERAKDLLAQSAPRVTEIGLSVGFSETSSFTAAFRKATGFTPTSYHRSLA